MPILCSKLFFRLAWLVVLELEIPACSRNIGIDLWIDRVVVSTLSLHLLQYAGII